MLRSLVGSEMCIRDRSLRCQRSLIVAGDGVAPSRQATASRRRVTCLITLNYPRLRCLHCLRCLRLLVGPGFGLTDCCCLLAFAAITLCDPFADTISGPLEHLQAISDVLSACSAIFFTNNKAIYLYIRYKVVYKHCYQGAWKYPPKGLQKHPRSSPTSL